MDTFAQLFGRSVEFETQLSLPQHRMCGAAALVMAYRKCNIAVDQQTVWNKIASEHNGSFRAHTFRMAQDAIDRGLAALIIQSHQPLKILRACSQNNLAAVINHRLECESQEGHYSLLAGIGRDQIVVHDPLVGPQTKIAHEQFLKLWLPYGQHCEIAGNIVLAIANPNELSSVHAHCNRIFDDTTRCRHCDYSISLKPASALGCWNPQCPQRLWYRLFCPRCDFPIEQLPEV